MTRDDEEEFSALAQTISREAGFALHAYKEKCLRRRIAVRMRACGVHTYREYLSVLEHSREEVGKLRDTLTINVTKFYRNADTWRRLGAVLPALCRERQGHVRVWSAGCSSGEEPYTLAMVWADVLEATGQEAWFSRLRVDATDIDRLSLERARAGRYPAATFDEAPPHFRDDYCLPCEGGYQVRPEYRSVVDIRDVDLVREAPLRTEYDLILCRNVVIYFDRPTQERTFQAFADALVPGGYLVLGKVETLLGPAQRRFTMLDVRERLYRKVA